MRTIHRVAALVYATLAMLVAVFQVALALGAPLGAYAMGGAVSGPFPPALRALSIAQATLHGLFAGVILARSGIAFQALARRSAKLAWLVVVMIGVSAGLNAITPSGGERVVWTPVVLVMFLCSLVVATSPIPRAN